jgi:hypothetical protein
LLSARARVRRRYQHEARGEGQRQLQAGERHRAVLERLAQQLEHLARKLGQFVGEQRAIVRQRAGTKAGPFSMKVTIPAKTTAKVYLPAVTNARLTESGKPVDAQLSNGEYVVQVGSGTYDFQVK